MPDLQASYQEIADHPKDYALSWYEQQEADRLASKDYKTKAEVALGIGAAFLLYRSYMQRTVQAQLKRQGEYSYSALDYAMSVAYAGFVPAWSRMLINTTTINYVMGLADSIGSDVIPPELLYGTAEQYVDKLGTYMNDSTKDAVLKGYQAQVNRNVVKQRAVSNVLNALGSTNRAMNTLVNLWTAKKEKKLTDQRLPDTDKKTAERLIQADLSARSKVFGSNEAEVQQSQIQQIVWMYSADKGIIPEDTRRVWRTAKDERVCPMCGPMHKVALPVHEKFNVSGIKLWSPPVHIGCRCKAVLEYDYKTALDREIHELVEAEPVGKSMGSDKYDRDSHGRFASHESRQPKKTFKVAEANPETQRIQQMFNEARQRSLQDLLNSNQEEEPEKQLKRTLEPRKLESRSLKRKLDERKLEGRKLTSSRQLQETEQEAPQRGKLKPLRSMSRGPLNTDEHGSRRKLRATRGPLLDTRKKRPLADIIEDKAPDNDDELMDSSGGIWYKMDQKMAAFVGYGHLDNEVSTDDYGNYYSTADTDFHLLSAEDEEASPQSLEYSIGEYWDSVLTAMTDQFEMHPDLTLDEKVRDEDGNTYEITSEDYMAAAAEVVNNVSAAHSEKVTLYSTDGMREYETNLRDVAFQTGIENDVWSAMPTVIVTDYIQPHTYQESGAWARNPGSWTEELTLDSGELSDWPCYVVYVRPQ